MINLKAFKRSGTGRRTIEDPRASAMVLVVFVVLVLLLAVTGCGSKPQAPLTDQHDVPQSPL